MEQRLFERVRVPAKFKYEVKTRPKLIKDSMTINISGSGVCLSLREKLLPKTRVLIKTNIGPNKSSIGLEGIVVWTRRAELIEDIDPNACYDTGIEFIDASSINVDMIISQFDRRPL